VRVFCGELAKGVPCLWRRGEGEGGGCRGIGKQGTWARVRCLGSKKCMWELYDCEETGGLQHLACCCTLSNRATIFLIPASIVQPLASVPPIRAGAVQSVMCRYCAKNHVQA